MLTWSDIDPLFKPNWQGEGPAWALLVRPEVKAIHYAAIRRILHNRSPSRERAEELYHESLSRLMDRLKRHQGMNPPSRTYGSPQGWLWVLLRNISSESLRASEEERSDADLDEVSLLLAEEDAEDKLFAKMSVGSALKAIDEMEDVYVLAFSISYAIDLLEYKHVARVCEADGERLRRGPVETWRHLKGLRRWMDSSLDLSDKERSEGRREQLAWILMSDDQTSPRRWREREPAEFQRGWNLFRKWVSRGLEAIKASLGAQNVD